MAGLLRDIAESIPIHWGRYADKQGKEHKTFFLSHEKAIYGADGERLDNKLSNIENSISDAYSDEKDYAVGDYCIFLNRLYKFIAPKSAGGVGRKCCCAGVADG